MSTIQDVLANIHVDIGNPSGGDNGVTLPVGDDLFVAPNVDIVDGSSVSFDVYCAGTGSAQIDGDLSGANGVVFAGQLNSLGQAAGKTTIDIGPTGSVQTFSDPSVYAAVEIQNGDFSVTNDGFIDSASAGIAVDSKQPTNASDPGTGTIDNLGVIAAGNGGDAIDGQDLVTVINSGQIIGAVGLLESSSLENSGTIDGNVFLSLEGSFDNSGSITGNVNFSGYRLTDEGAIHGFVSTQGGGNAANVTQILVAAGAVIEGDGRSASGSSLDYAFQTTVGYYSINNNGTIEDSVGETSTCALLLAGAGSVVNGGKIYAEGYGYYNDNFIGDDYLFNTGVISAQYYAVFAAATHSSRVVNFGTISAPSGSAFAAIDIQSAGGGRVVNGGSVSGDVFFAATGSTLVNSGSVDGDIVFALGSARVVNSGTIDGSVTFSGSGNVYHGEGGSFTGTVTGSGADDRFYGGAGDEYFSLTAAGAKVAVGGTGTTTFDYGADFTNAMAVTGGTGTTVVDLEGNYAGASELFLGARTMVGVSKLTLGAGFNYAIVANASTVANGQTMTVDGSALNSANTLLFDASHDVGGFYDFIGGAGQNTFTFATYNLFANDVVQAGSGAGNILRFITAGNVSAQQMANVTGISTIKLQSGANDIQLNDSMVTKAYGHTLTVNLNAGDDVIDSSQLTTATNTVEINAASASGGDTFIFGAAKEFVAFAASPTSTGPAYDTIANFNFNTDGVSVAGYTPAGIGGAVTTGSLSTATFDSDLANALGAGQLGAGDAVLFTASGGTLAGDTFLVASTNGVAGYTAGDLVVRLTGTTTGALGVGNV